MVSNKRINPAAINALKNALTQIYWFKRDLRSFLINALDNSRILSQLNWDDYKRNIVGLLVDYLARNQDKYLNDLLNLIYAVCAIDDFTHLERLEDGQEKAKSARKAVDALRKLSEKHIELFEEKKNAEKRRQEYLKRVEHSKFFGNQLEHLYKKYKELASSGSPQHRGYELEKLLKDLFELFDLDPKASFRLKGEQIDGAFTFEGIDYLVEVKWQNEPIGASDLDSLDGKVRRKLDNTLGLFISINGFSSDAIEIHSRGRPVLILMDGGDLVTVLENRIDLQELLRRKKRHAAQTGEIFLPYWKMI